MVPERAPTEGTRGGEAGDQQRSFRHALAEVYFRSRRKEITPGRFGLSVAMGVFVGCQPVYGFHLALCLVIGRLFSLSVTTAYLAAHLNNPWTAPGLLYLEAAVGRSLVSGEWNGLSWQAIRASSPLEIGRDVSVGGLTVGAVAAVLLGALAFMASRRRTREPWRARFIDLASRPYRGLGIRTWEFVRGKLRHDPCYVEILRSGILPARGRLLDLGCGGGNLLSAIRAARQLALEGAWPAGWPPPPADLELVGVEADQKAAAVAEVALAGEATIEWGDIARENLPACDAIALLDVLHYLRPREQVDLIGRAAEALRPKGVLLIREADAGLGLRTALTRIQERLCAWGRGEWTRRFHYRTAPEWSELLARNGFKAKVSEMWKGTPFSNVLIEARRTSGYGGEIGKKGASH